MQYLHTNFDPLPRPLSHQPDGRGVQGEGTLRVGVSNNLLFCRRGGDCFVGRCPPRNDGCGEAAVQNAHPICVEAIVSALSFNSSYIPTRGTNVAHTQQ